MCQTSFIIRKKALSELSNLDLFMWILAVIKSTIREH